MRLVGDIRDSWTPEQREQFIMDARHSFKKTSVGKKATRWRR